MRLKRYALMIAVCLLAAGCALAAPAQFRQSGFSPGAAGWTTWSDRPANAPRAFVEPVISIGEPGSLGLSGNGDLGVYGGWQKIIPDVRAGSWYRFTASYRATGLTAENWQVLPSVGWRTAGGRQAGSYEQVDYASRATRRGEWTSVVLETQAPPDAASAIVQLFLAHAPSAMVWWDEVGFEEIPAPGRKPVTIASINLKPQKTRSPEESVTQFLEAADRLVSRGADIILFPEGITVVGNGKPGDEVAEPVPGPTTARLGELARKKNAYVAAGIYEREGAVVYNTAVFLDRGGNVIGRYRKVHLPVREMEKITPGNEYPVFRTDFGSVGLMICYDVFFADPARALALQGADIILLPIWGGNETLATARAIENHVFLVTSGYDHPTYIMDPSGKRIAEASGQGTAAIATVDLNQRYLYLGLWDWKNRRPREYHPEVRTQYVP